MKPNLDRLSEGQKRLWPELSSTPQEFTLFGGIALSIRFGHRHTSDFDFFSRSELDPEELYHRVPYLKSAEVLQLAPNTLICSVERGEPVKVSFFGLPNFGIAGDPEIVENLDLKVSPLIELAGTKTSVVQKRAVARDYLDLDLLLSVGKVSLTDALIAGRKLYGRLYNPHVALKALTFFGDGDLMSLPEELRDRLAEAATQVDLAYLANKIEELS
ncbi:MAG: nucleotidyl transferase AbiEii/AbiGii toxin family protein [Candidatus Eremiobacteraeota bacterium]|nr:nucleotidyl transferase AbiEii/AbiGii toxin family protein [Candidatus Eremiobacteraeota bacterium]